MSVDSNNRAPHLTVLSYGIGQDSWTILVKLVKDKEFRQQYAPGKLLVIAADTGNEHPDTYEHADYTKKFCAQHGVEFVHITKEMGYHADGWQTLQHYFSKHNNIASKAYPKTCSDQLKIQPIYRYLEDYIESRYGFAAGRKAGLKKFAENFGKIDVLIGIAKGEEKRVSVGEDPKPWMNQVLRKRYPLIEIGFGRAECQQYLKQAFEPVPPPSNCIMCPFKSKIEVLWTARNLPQQFDDWVQYEANKIEAWKDRVSDPSKNLGVNGKKLLPQVLREAEAEYANMSNQDINEYRMSHGHLCKNKF